MLSRRLHSGGPLALRHALAEGRSVAAIEFAMVAPLLITMALAVFDLARAVVIWEQINNAAEAIAEAAEKLSVTKTTGPSPTLTSMLNRVQIQAAMSTIYVEILGLDYGNGDGNFPGKFAVTLSSVAFLPLCTKTTGCAPQTPNTVWSAYLVEGGPQLETAPAPPAPNPLVRACGTLTPVPQFPDDDSELLKMVQPFGSPTTTMPNVPQVVADVQYNYTPLVFLGAKTFTLWASATLPAPVNGLAQEVLFDKSQGATGVEDCGA